MRAMDESDNRSTLRKSISCMVAGLLFTVGLSMLAFAEMFDWQPGRPALVFWSAVTMIVVGGIWLGDEIRDTLRR